MYVNMPKAHFILTVEILLDELVRMISGCQLLVLSYARHSLTSGSYKKSGAEPQNCRP